MVQRISKHGLTIISLYLPFLGTSSTSYYPRLLATTAGTTASRCAFLPECSPGEVFFVDVHSYLLVVYIWYDIWNCSCYGGVLLLQHGMKVVERLLYKRLHRTVTVDKMQFGFMSERAVIDAVFNLK